MLCLFSYNQILDFYIKRFFKILKQWKKLRINVAIYKKKYKQIKRRANKKYRFIIKVKFSLTGCKELIDVIRNSHKKHHTTLKFYNYQFRSSQEGLLIFLSLANQIIVIKRTK